MHDVRFPHAFSVGVLRIEHLEGLACSSVAGFDKEILVGFGSVVHNGDVWREVLMMGLDSFLASL
jgi:hypothetical protein